MKKLLILFLTLGLLVGASAAWAYTINDASNDAIGVEFESYGIDVLNYTPGVDSGPITLKIYTDYPQAGVTVGSWVTTAADVFISETYYGNSYLWAIPLVSRPGFDAGTMYAVAVGGFKISDDFDPGGGFIYNHNVPTQISAIGNNYGNTSFGGGSVNWAALGSLPNWEVTGIPGGHLYQDDPSGKWNITWGTATCANDVVGGDAQVPIPPSALLLGTGLLGLVGFGWRRRQANA